MQLDDKLDAVSQIHATLRVAVLARHNVGLLPLISIEQGTPETRGAAGVLLKTAAFKTSLAGLLTDIRGGAKVGARLEHTRSSAFCSDSGLCLFGTG